MFIENIELLLHYQAIIKLTTADLDRLIIFICRPDSLLLHNLHLFGDIYKRAF